MKKLRITVEGKSYDVTVETLDEGAPSSAPASPRRSSAVAAPSAASAPKAAVAAAGSGQVPSPLAGKVVSVDAPAGSAVKAGDKLMTLEAMKMNTFVTSPSDGTVQEVHVTPGDSVEEGQALVTLS